MLKRWISSTKRIVRRPSRRTFGSAITSLISLMPLSTALKGMNSHRAEPRHQLVSASSCRLRGVPLIRIGQTEGVSKFQIWLRIRFAGAENVLLAD